MADQEVVALVARARDEASAALAKIHKSIGDLATQANLGGRALGGLHSVLSGIAQGVGISIFFDLQNIISRIASSIPDLISKGMQWGLTVDQISDATGATAEASSKLAYEFQFLGISTSDLNSLLGRTAVNVRAHETEMNKLGIVTRDANGAFIDQVAQLDAVRHALAGMADGSAKANAIIKIFGKSGLELADYLGLSDAQVKLLTDDAANMGLILDQKARAAAENAAREMNRFQLSLTGLASTIFQDIAPALIAFVDGITNWVQQNTAQIATFVQNAAAFIFGLINALTGSSLSLDTFTAKLGLIAPAATGTGAAIDEAFDPTKDKVDKGTAAIQLQVRAIDDEEKALDREKKAIGDQITAIEDKRRAQEDASNAAKKGIQDELNGQLALLDAAARQRRETETEAQLNQELIDAQRALQIAQGGTNGVVDPDAVHSALLRVNDIKQQMADNAFDQGQEQQRTELQADADTNTQKIDNAQAAADAKAKAATDALTAEETAIDAAKQKLEDQKTHLQDQMAQMRSAIAATTTGPGGLGPKFQTAAALATTATGLVLPTISGPQGLTQAMKDAGAAGAQMGQDIKDALDKAMGAIGGAIDLVSTLARVVGGIDKNELAIGLLALGVATGNPILALAGAALMAGNVLNAGPTADPRGNAGPGHGSRVPMSAPVAPFPRAGGIGEGMAPVGSTVIEIHNYTILDGAQVAESVSRHQLRDARLMQPSDPRARI